FFSGFGCHRHLHSFPTRRSSDLRGAYRRDSRRPGRGGGDGDGERGGGTPGRGRGTGGAGGAARHTGAEIMNGETRLPHDIGAIQDRKSTRLNSSHVKISYAVFCL